MHLPSLCEMSPPFARWGSQPSFSWISDNSTDVLSLQSVVAMGELGVQLSDPDTPALDILNEILNSFGGRLFNEIRSREVPSLLFSLHHNAHEAQGDGFGTTFPAEQP